MEPTAALPYQSTDLVTVDEILDGRCPDDDHHMDPAGQVLQQRAQRGDPYSGTNQRDAIRHADMARERSVGSLDGHAGSGLELTNGTALVAEPLDGHPDMGGPGQRGQRVRVRLPPEVSGEEAPEEELAPGYRQAIEPPTPADDREHARCVLGDRDDPQLMAEAPPDRLSDPEHQSHAPGGRPDRHPNPPPPSVPDQWPAGH